VIDSHAHLYFDKFDGDRAAVIARAREIGVGAVINIGTEVATSEQSVALAREHRGFYATVGLHPTYAVPDLDEALGKLESLARASPGLVVGVGEIGLDYYWKEIPKEVQMPRLERQLELARRLGLPVVYHCRDALADLFAVLERQPAQPPGVFHCFSGNAADARRALDLGYHVSFAGNVTYPKAVDLQEALRAVPLEKLLLETDCPFLAPQPVRGKRNEPAFVRHTRDFIAGVKGATPEEVERVTDATARRLFRLGGNEP
jgi:TatD DNase family protein